jgi:hypothetical protein
MIEERLWKIGCYGGPDELQNGKRIRHVVADAICLYAKKIRPTNRTVAARLVYFAEECRHGYMPDKCLFSSLHKHLENARINGELP